MAVASECTLEALSPSFPCLACFASIPEPVPVAETKMNQIREGS